MTGILSHHPLLRRGLIPTSPRVFSRSGVITHDEEVDPLAGIPTTLRLQTHRGDGVPLGLYQDTACTIPALADGDPIAAWRDEISGSGLVAVQPVSNKRPILRMSERIPQLEFDGVDDFLTVELPRPFPFSMALCTKNAGGEFGGMAGYGYYNVAIGNYYHGLSPDKAFWIWSPDRSVGYGEENSIDGNWHVHVGLIPNGNVNKADWRMYMDGLQTGSPGTPAGDTILDTATVLHLGQDGYGAHWSGRMTSYLQGNEIWTTEEVEMISDYLGTLKASSISDIAVSLRLQTHKGDGVPLGLYQDVACSIPAFNDGAPVAAWRDELSGSGVVLTQSDPARRPNLRFERGVPYVVGDGIDDTLHHTFGTSLTGDRCFFSTGYTDYGSGNFSRLFSTKSGTSADYGGDSIIPSIKIGTNNQIGCFHTGSTRSAHDVPDNTWFTHQIRKTSSGSDSWINGNDKQSYVGGDATIVKELGILDAPQTGSADEHWRGGVQFIAITGGNLSDADLLRVASYQQSLLPPTP